MLHKVCQWFSNLGHQMFLDRNSLKSWTAQQVVKASENCSPRTSGDPSLRITEVYHTYLVHHDCLKTKTLISLPLDSIFPAQGTFNGWVICPLNYPSLTCSIIVFKLMVSSWYHIYSNVT